MSMLFHSTPPPPHHASSPPMYSYDHHALSQQTLYYQLQPPIAQDAPIGRYFWSPPLVLPLPLPHPKFNPDSDVDQTPVRSQPQSSTQMQVNIPSPAMDALEEVLRNASEQLGPQPVIAHQQIMIQLTGREPYSPNPRKAVAKLLLERGNKLRWRTGKWVSTKSSLSSFL